MMRGRPARALIYSVGLGITVLVGSTLARAGDPAIDRLAELVESRRYLEADRLGRELVARIDLDDAFELDERSRVFDLLGRAIREGLLEWREGAVELVERAVTYEELVHGPMGVAVADRLETEAAVLFALGRLEAALASVERSLSIRRAASDGDDPAIAAGMVLRAQIVAHRGSPDEAETLVREALRRLEDTRGPMHRDTAAALRVLGDLHGMRGEMTEAESLLARAVEIQSEVLGPHPSLALAWNNLGMARQGLGDLEAALACFESAGGIWEEVYGGEHPRAAYAWINAGRVYQKTAPVKARAPLERAYDIQQRTLPTGHKDRVYGSWNLGRDLLQTGEYEKAIPLFEESVAIWKEVYGEDHVFLAETLWGLAGAHHALGDDARAEPLYRSALAIAERNDSDQHVAWIARDLGRLALEHGDLDEAGELLHRAEAARERGVEYPGAKARSFSALADLALAHGDLQTARSRLETAIDVQIDVEGPESPYLATLCRQLAAVLERLAEFDRARELYERALAIETAAFGEDHPGVVSSRVGLGRVLLARGELADAIEVALPAMTSRSRHLRLIAGSLPERVALLHAGRIPDPSGVLLSALSMEEAGEATQRAAFEAVVENRAVVLDAMALRHRATAALEADPEVRRARESLATARTRLANLVVRGPGDLPLEAYRGFVEEAKTRKEDAERALGRAGVGGGGIETIEFEDLVGSLPRDMALVGYVRYDRKEPAATDETGNFVPGGPSVSHYAAWIVRPAARAPTLVTLGPADPVERAIREWRRAVATPPPAVQSAARASERDYLDRARELRRLIWDPIASHLADAKSVAVIPSGDAHLVQFGTLTDEDGHYLIETGPTVHVLTTERELVRPAKSPSAASGLLALGGADFDTWPSLPSGPSEIAGVRFDPEVFERATYRGVKPSCTAFDTLTFDPLPGSSAEIAETSSIWSSVYGGGGDGVTTLLGVSAHESLFKQAVAGRRVVHLATHGFFLGHECADPSVDGVASPGVDASPGSAANVLLLSGLAMAGANRRDLATGDADDGVLTAEEIATLPFDGVEWVVLSACDTGTGAVLPGEGVFGLRRAFVIAGARTVIMSLWSIEDQMARRWVRELYTNRFGEGRSTAESVRRASLRLLEERRAAGRSAHPFHWGAFVSVGDWR